MLEQLLNDIDFLNLPQALQDLVKQLFKYSEQGFTVLPNTYPLIKIENNLEDNLGRHYGVTSNFLNIVNTNFDEFTKTLFAAMDENEEYRKQLSLAMFKSIQEGSHETKDPDSVMKISALTHEVKDLKQLAILLINKKNLSIQSNITDITSELLNLKNEAAFLLKEKINECSIQIKQLSDNLFDQYCSNKENIKFYITDIYFKKQYISPVTAKIFALTKGLSFVEMSEGKVVKENIIPHQSIILFDSNKVSLLLDSFGYDVRSIWNLIARKDIPITRFVTLLRCNNPNFVRNVSNMSLHKSNDTIDYLSLVPNETILNIMEYLMPKGNYEKPSSYKNLINFGNTNNRFNKLVPALNWKNKLTKMMDDKYGYELEVKLDDLSSCTQASSYEHLKRDIKNKTIMQYKNFFQSKAFQDNKILNNVISYSGYYYLKLAILNFKKLEDLSNPQQKTIERIILKCITTSVSAIKEGNHTTWFFLYYLMFNKRGNLPLISRELKLNFKIDDSVDVFKFIRDECIKYLQESSGNQEIINASFDLMVNNSYSGYDCLKIFINNFKKAKSAFFVLSKLDGFVIKYEALDFLSKCTSPEDIITVFTPDEIKQLLSLDLGKKILKLVTKDTTYTKIETRLLIDFYIKCLRKLKSLGEGPENSLIAKLHKFDFDTLNFVLLSANAQLLISKFAFIELCNLFVQSHVTLTPNRTLGKENSSYYCYNENPNQILNFFTDKINQKILVNFDCDTILEMLILRNMKNSISVSKLKACTLPISLNIVHLLKKCGMLTRVDIDDLVYLILNNDFSKQFEEDLQYINHANNISFKNLITIYKSENTIASFRKNVALFNAIHCDLLGLLLKDSFLLTDILLPLLSKLSFDLRSFDQSFQENCRDWSVIVERLKLIYKNPSIVTFFTAYPHLFVSKKLMLEYLEKIDLQFLGKIESLDEITKKIVLQSQNFLSILFNNGILKKIPLNDLCNNVKYLNLLHICRTLDFDILSKWNVADVEKIFSSSKSLTKNILHILESAPELFTYITSVKELKLMCDSPLLSRIMQCPNKKILASLGFKELLKAGEYQLNIPFKILYNRPARLGSISILLSDIILGCGNDDLWQEIYRQTSGSLIKIVEFINGNQLINSLLQKDDAFLDLLFKKLTWDEIVKLSTLIFSNSNGESLLDYFVKLSPSETVFIFSGDRYSIQDILSFDENEALFIKLVHLTSFSLLGITKEQILTIKKVMLGKLGSSTVAEVFLKSKFITTLLSNIRPSSFFDFNIIVNHPLINLLLLFNEVSYPNIILARCTDGNPIAPPIKKSSKKSTNDLSIRNQLSIKKIDIDNKLEDRLQFIEAFHKVQFDSNKSLLEWMSGLKNPKFVSFLFSIHPSEFNDRNFFKLMTQCDSDHPIFALISSFDLITLANEIIDPHSKSFFEILTLPGAKNQFDSLVTLYPKSEDLLKHIKENKFSICSLMIWANQNYTLRNQAEINNENDNLNSGKKQKRKINFIAELTNEAKRMKPSKSDDSSTELACDSNQANSGTNNYQ